MKPFKPIAAPPILNGQVILTQEQWSALVAHHNAIVSELNTTQVQLGAIANALREHDKKIKALAGIVKEIYTDET